MGGTTSYLHDPRNKENDMFTGSLSSQYNVNVDEAHASCRISSIRTHAFWLFDINVTIQGLEGMGGSRSPRRISSINGSSTNGVI